MASPLILALGGTRSGKSRFGLAAASSPRGGRPGLVPRHGVGRRSRARRPHRRATAAERPRLVADRRGRRGPRGCARRNRSGRTRADRRLHALAQHAARRRRPGDRSDPRWSRRRRSGGHRRPARPGDRRQRRGRLRDRAHAPWRTGLPRPRRDRPPAPGIGRRRGPSPRRRDTDDAQGSRPDLDRPVRHTFPGARDRRKRRFARTSPRVRPLDADAMAAAQHHLDRLTKPTGSLGQFEEISSISPGSRAVRGRASTAVRSSSRPPTTASPDVACRRIHPTSPPRWSRTSSPAGVR